MVRADKRRQIMQAAERLCASRRIHEITMDDVAASAGVGKGTIYRYFRDKDDLFLQIVNSGFDELCELVEREGRGQPGFDRQLLEVCRHVTGFFERRRQLFAMMQSEDTRMYWCKGDLRQKRLLQRRRLLSAVGGVIDRGKQEGRVRADLPGEVLAAFLLGMLRARTRDLLNLPERYRRHELVVELFCRGVADGAAAEAPPRQIRKTSAPGNRARADAH
jgi:AcrR family transcriptional regulator